MRLFIAIELPESVRRAVAGTSDALRAFGARGRFVPAENYHVTLRFIGESNALSDLADAMRDAACDCRPFALHLNGYGAFSGSGGNTGFVRVAGDKEELFRLYETLEAALCDRGFGRGRGRFVPHITLGRNIVGDEGLCSSPGESFSVRQITLFESRRERGGVLYVPLHRQPFC